MKPFSMVLGKLSCLNTLGLFFAFSICCFKLAIFWFTHTPPTIMEVPGSSKISHNALSSSNAPLIDYTNDQSSQYDAGKNNITENCLFQSSSKYTLLRDCFKSVSMCL